MEDFLILDCLSLATHAHTHTHSQRHLLPRSLTPVHDPVFNNCFWQFSPSVHGTRVCVCEGGADRVSAERLSPVLPVLQSFTRRSATSTAAAVVFMASVGSSPTVKPITRSVCLIVLRLETRLVVTFSISEGVCSSERVLWCGAAVHMQRQGKRGREGGGGREKEGREGKEIASNTLPTAKRVCLLAGDDASDTMRQRSMGGGEQERGTTTVSPTKTNLSRGRVVLTGNWQEMIRDRQPLLLLPPQRQPVRRLQQQVHHAVVFMMRQSASLP